MIRIVKQLKPQTDVFRSHIRFILLNQLDLNIYHPIRFIVNLESNYVSKLSESNCLLILLLMKIGIAARSRKKKVNEKQEFNTFSSNFVKLFTFLMTSDISVFKHFIHQMLRCEMLQQLFWCLWNDDWVFWLFKPFFVTNIWGLFIINLPF